MTAPVPYISVVIPTHNHCWPHTVAGANVAVPGRQPAVAQEDGAISILLKRTPLFFDRGKVFANGQSDAAARRDQAGIGDRIDLYFESFLRRLRHWVSAPA